jgi:hypothetical protein
MNGEKNRRTGLAEPPAAEEPHPLIDTSKMSAGQRAALELTEGARETARGKNFAGGLFMGEFDLAGLGQFPEQSLEDREKGDVFLRKLEALLHEKVDADEIDRTGEIPQPVIDELAKLGAFGIKVPVEYGGLGLSQTNYCRAAWPAGRFPPSRSRKRTWAPIRRRWRAMRSRRRTVIFSSLTAKNSGAPTARGRGSSW